MPGRDVASPLIKLVAEGYLGCVIHENTLSHYLNDKRLSPILQDLIVKSSLPLASLEGDSIALDSTYFAGSRFVRAYDIKYHGQIEPEIAFADLADNVALAEALLKYTFAALLNERPEDLAFFDQRIEKGLVAKLEGIVGSEFVHMDYGEAIEVLERANEKFEFPVNWGVDLQSEHERYLTEKYAKKPVTVMNYPKAIKTFSMRVNDDGRTLAAMDVSAAASARSASRYWTAPENPRKRAVLNAGQQTRWSGGLGHELEPM